MSQLTQEDVIERIMKRKSGEVTSKKSSAPAFAFSPLGPRTEEAQALDLLTLNALLFGVPTKIASELGFEGPQAAVERARAKTGGYGAAAEAVGTLPLAIAGGAGARGAGELIKRGLLEGSVAGVGLSERGSEVSGGLLGGLTGAALPAIPAVGGVIKRAFDPIRKRMADPTETAERKVLETMKSLNITPEGLLSSAAEKAPVTLAEMTGREFAAGLEPMVRQAAEASGPAYVRVAEQLGERGKKSIDRIVASMTDLPAGDAFETATDLAAKRKANSAPLYESAYLFEPSASDRKVFANLAKSPEFQRGFNKAKSRLKDLAAVSEELKDIKIPEKITLSNVPEFTRVMDLTKRSIDDRISSSIRKGKFDEASGLQMIKEDLLGKLDEVNPDYAKARQQFAGDIAVENALTMGQDIFSKNIPLQKVESFFKNATKSEKESFRLGVSQAIRDSIEDGQVGRVKKLLSKDAVRKFERVWPSKESFSKFTDTVNREIKMAESAKRMIPSPRVQEEVGILGDVARNVLSPAVTGRAARQGGRISAGLVAAGNLIRSSLSQKGMSPEEALEVTNILMTSTPAGRKNVLDRLVARNAISENDKATFTRIFASGAVPTAAATGLLMQD